MTVRLVKRKEPDAADQKEAQRPSETQLILTTQGWVEEFKTRKARTDQSLGSRLRRD